MINILDFAKDISHQAGLILTRGFRSDDTVISYKSKTNLITNIDRVSEEFLCSKISEAFPSHGIVAEEGNIKETKGEFIWYVDPLDGTNNYAHGIPFFCISLGIYSRELQRTAAGVVYDPIHNEMFSGIIDGGASLNGRNIRVSSADDMGISMLATGFPYSHEDPETNNLVEFNKFLPQIQGIRRIGSAALDLCYVACGRLDGYWEPALHPWDMAGGSIIVEEAGGRVTKYDGSSFDPLHPEIVASNGIIHGAIINILRSK